MLVSKALLGRWGRSQRSTALFRKLVAEKCGFEKEPGLWKQTGNRSYIPNKTAFGLGEVGTSSRSA